MIQQFSATRVQSGVRSFSRNLMAALALGMLFTACSKDDDDNDGGGPGNPPPAEEGYFSTNTNKVLKYRAEDDGEFDEYDMRVANKKDSANGKVVRYKVAYDDGSEMYPFVYYTNSQVVFANTLPSDFAETMAEIEEDPDVTDFTMSGFPLLQKLSANPKVNDAVEFSDNIHIGWNQHDEDDVYEINMDFVMSEGKVAAFEDVTTPAGTFKNCMKIQYKTTLTTKLGNTPMQTMVTQHAQWYAKGVGIVKSTETVGNKISTTTLVAIQ